MTQLAAPLPAPLVPPRLSPGAVADRLVSLDVFRGVVILAMLLVNNLGDYRAVSFFWKHADWKPENLLADFRAYFAGLPQTGPAGGEMVGVFPLFWHCTLADFVMPWFMLIIGVAVPFSVAAALGRGDTGVGHWVRVVRRGAMLYALGWALGLSLQFLAYRFSANAEARLGFTLGMDVLQLLGVSYVLCRLGYCLPRYPRLVLAGALFLAHWSLLRYLPQGEVPAGTFTGKNNAVSYAYAHWPIFQAITLIPSDPTPFLRFSIAGMLSAVPATATMLIGTYLGDTLRAASLSPTRRAVYLLVTGLLLIGVGVLWAFDLPMNKVRWSPCYLVYCSGVGSVLLAGLYYVIDVRLAGSTLVRRSVWPIVALGVNAIGIYFISIFLKIWLLNMVKVVGDNGQPVMLTTKIVATLQSHFGAVGGSWVFTVVFVGVVWSAAMFAWSRRLVWKV